MGPGHLQPGRAHDTDPLANRWLEAGHLARESQPSATVVARNVSGGFASVVAVAGTGSSDVLSIAAVKSLSQDPYATKLILAEVAALLLYFSATLVFTDTPHRLRLLVRTITIFGFVLAIFGLTQSFTTTKVYWVRELSQSTAFGPFINRHHFAGYMELTISLPLGMLFAGSIEKDKRFAYIFAVILMGVALILTNSRGGIISLVAEIGFLVVISGFRRHKGKETHEKSHRIKGAALRAALALGLIFALFAGVVLLGGESALSRFAGTVNSEDPTTGRAHFWNVTVDIIKAHPIVGTGLELSPLSIRATIRATARFGSNRCTTITCRYYLMEEFFSQRLDCSLSLCCFGRDSPDASLAMNSEVALRSVLWPVVLLSWFIAFSISLCIQQRTLCFSWCWQRLQQ